MQCPLGHENEIETLENFLLIDKRNFGLIVNPSKHGSSVRYQHIDLKRCKTCGIIFG